MASYEYRATDCSMARHYEPEMPWLALGTIADRHAASLMVMDEQAEYEPEIQGTSGNRSETLIGDPHPGEILFG